MKVGLTGNIFSGYDKVADVFRMFGVPVFDADVCVKFLINFREDIMKNIRIQFGSDIYNKGLIDQSKFNTTEKFDRLLAIVELDLVRLYEAWRMKNKYSFYTVFKCGILYERKLNELMNFTISTFRPKDDRALDLSQVGVRITEAFDIIDAEMDELMKNQRSEWTIHNYNDNINGTLITQVRKIHQQIEKKVISSKSNITTRDNEFSYDNAKNILS